MLSILIPIYNHNVVKLVEELKAQCLKSNIAFEILCLDDGSTLKHKEKNRIINGLLGVNYVELSENFGRAQVRNKLIKLARYDFALFIDADSKIPSKKYIKNYLKAINDHPDIDIINGGRLYTKTKPKTASKLLHWTYGLKRESSTLDKRNKRPIELFHSNNFGVRLKSVRHISFDVDLKQYGYEDLLWASKAASAGLKILHIDNPVVHGQLKKSQEFINDCISSMNNLSHLYLTNKIETTRLIRAHQLLQRIGLLRPLLKLLKNQKDRIYKRLKSHNPKLIYLDLLKLHYFDKALRHATK